MIELKYGNKRLLLDEPDNFDYMNLSKVCTEKKDNIEEQKQEVIKALENPYETLPINDWVSTKDKIAIIVPDITRKYATSVYMPILIDKLEKIGINKENVKIIIAVGNHRKNNKEEIIEILGEEIYKKYTVLNHDSLQNLEYIGETSFGNKVRINKYVAQADKIILTGGAAFHNFAGYSGGRKGILPGVSASETILYNHKLMGVNGHMNKNSDTGILKDNPINEDMVEAMKMVGTKRIFLLNVVTNMHNEIINAFAGCPITAYRKACEFVKSNYAIKIKDKYDIIICSSGGYPFDYSFYQSYKGAYCALNALKENGIIILLGKCTIGYGEGADEIGFWFSKDKKGILNTFDDRFDMNGKIAYDVRLIQERSKEYYLVTDNNDEMIDIIGDIKKIRSEEYNKEVKKIIERFKHENNREPKICFVPYANITLFTA